MEDKPLAHGAKCGITITVQPNWRSTQEAQGDSLLTS